MKKYVTTIIPVAIICTLLFCTSRSDAFYANQDLPRDTMKFYSVSTFSSRVNNRVKYEVDGRRVNKKEYDKYHVPNSKIDACIPCYAKWYSKNDHLLYEGDMYTDCPVGYWKEYYPNGKVKVEGNFKGDPTNRYDTAHTKEWCNIRDGKWMYFSQSGKIDSVVHYLDGKRVK